MLFGLQMTSYEMFDDVVKMIDEFRINKVKNKGKYKQFKNSIQKNIIIELFDKEINSRC